MQGGNRIAERFRPGMVDYLEQELPMKLRLKWKIILPVSLMVLFSFAAVAVIAAGLIRKNALIGAENDISRTSQVIREMLETFFENIVNQSKILTGLPLTSSVIESCSSLDLSDKENAAIVAELDDVKRLGNILGAVHKAFDLNAAYLLNGKGRIIAAHDNKRLGDDLSGRDYYQPYRANTVPTFTNVDISRVTDRPTVIYLYPIFNANKELIATLLLSLDYTLFFDIHVNANNKGKNGYAFLLASDGRIIAHPKKELIDLKKPATFSFIPELIKRKEGTYFYDFPAGNPKIAAMVTLPSTGWICAVSADLDPFTAMADEIARYIVAAAVIAIILIAFVLYIIIQVQVNKPIECIVLHLKRFAGGELEILKEWEEYIPNRLLSRRDEVGEIGNAIHQLRSYILEMCGIADRIAGRNLDVDVKPVGECDSFGNAFKSMVENLNTAFSRAQSTASEVNSGAMQVSSASQSLSQGATEQAASLQEITATITEMGSQAKRNAENAGQASQLSNSAKSAAEDGQKQMQNLNTSISDITRKAEEVMKVNKVIDDIAFQTNLLALNAAVEAARAGRHGKGFAVVAEEVRNLAARSAKAAAETRDMIENVVTQIRQGNQLAVTTAEKLQDIASQISKTAGLVGEIAAASNEQAQGVMQISQGLEQIDQVTQQNTASAEQTASASQEMSQQASSLQNLVSEYRIRGGANQVSEPAQSHQPARLTGFSSGQDRLASGRSQSAQRAPARPAASDGWAVAGKDFSGKMVPPEQKIILDDDEFGKF